MTVKTTIRITVTLKHLKNEAIRDDRTSLTMTRFHHNAHLTAWPTFMAYIVLSPKGEEPLNTFLSPDADHLREEPSHYYNTSCVKN